MFGWLIQFKQIDGRISFFIDQSGHCINVHFFVIVVGWLVGKGSNFEGQ